MIHVRMNLIVGCTLTVLTTSVALALPVEDGVLEGCGELRLTNDPVPCVVFIAESGEFPFGLGIAGPNDWQGFEEGDRFHASGKVIQCGGFCTVSGCFDGTAVFQECTTVPPDPIPALTSWGVAGLALALLGLGIMVMSKRTRRMPLACVALSALALPQPAPAQPADVVAKVNRMLQTSHHTEHLLVRFKQASTEGERDAAHVAAGAVKIKRYKPIDGLTLVNVPSGVLGAALGSYLADTNTLYAEPDYWGEVAVTIPDDTYFCAQWGMRNTGDNIDDDCDSSMPPLECTLESGDACPHDAGTNDADIRAADAWDIWTGDPRYRVAILDTGIDYRHLDLKENIWTNPLEQLGDSNCDGCPGICGVDDDGDGLTDECPVELPSGSSCSWDDDENGWVDDIHGYDFVNSDHDPMDDFFHGTTVAGCIGAVGNNSLGVAGVNWRAKLVALKVANAQGFMLISDVVDAIGYMIVNDIKVSNNSYGFDVFSQSLRDAIEGLQTAGHIYVAIAHNQGSDIDPVCRPTSLQACCSDADCPVGETCDASQGGLARGWPAAYCLSNIISVAATDNDDALASFSNYGSTAVDLGAPGVAIYTTFLASYYGFINGTSFSAPHVTGVVALLWSRMPGLSWEDARDRIFDSVRITSSLYPPITVIGGVVNAHAALLDCNSNGIPDDQDISSGSSLDCNSNSFPDECEGDCNTNSIPDDCDITAGTSLDCNSNGVPDECESNRDCNNNQVQDICDTASGTSDDCNGNEVPDECEPCPDCNNNANLDSCDIDVGSSADLDSNGVPDECEDCNTNQIPDRCDIDCGNTNGPCDLTGCGGSADCNGDGTPDDCQGSDGACCLPDGSCQVYLETCCLADAGSYQGDGTKCMPLRTCCVGDGSCVRTTPTCCAAVGGSSQPKTTPACVAGTGVCCLQPNGCCVDSVEQDWCQNAGGLFHAIGSCPFTCGSQQGPQGP